MSQGPATTMGIMTSSWSKLTLTTHIKTLLSLTLENTAVLALPMVRKLLLYSNLLVHGIRKYCCANFVHGYGKYRCINFVHKFET